MRALCHVAGLVGLLLAAGFAPAQEQIPWVADFKQACEQAADQRRLVLLHFYGDHCPPCERVEQHVFTQPQVIQAISKNYVPVKVHVEQSAELAARYQVRRWPTDVICTSSGLEVQRSVSPQTAVEYITMIDQVALQAGVGAARQWSSNLNNVAASAVQQGAAESQAFANRMGESAQGYLNQAATTAQGYTNQATSTAQTYTNQAAGTFQGYANAAQGYASQAQQQLAQANQQYQQATEQANAAAGQAQQQFADARQQFQGAGQQLNATAQGAVADMRSTWNGAAAGLRSAWNGGAPASEPAAQPQPNVAVQQEAPANATPPIGTVPAGGYAVNPPPTTTYQPYQPQTTYQPETAPVSAPQTAFQPQTAYQPQVAPAPAAQAVVPQPATTNPYTAPSPAATASISPPQASGQLVPASQAPPSILDGYCPVSLLESMKWIKADPRFGAIHRNRTYLFATAGEQTRFLAEPDRYTPVLDGCDPVRFAKTGELVPGKRSCGITYNKQIFLFADEQTLAEFSRSPDSAKGYATAAYQAMLPKQGETAYR